VHADLFPLEAAVGGLEHHADASAAIGRLQPADGPSSVGRLEVDTPQRSPRAGLLPLPGGPAVDRMPDHAVIAHGPAFILVDELHGVNCGIFEWDLWLGGNGSRQR